MLPASLVDMGIESRLLVYEADTIKNAYEIMTGKKRYTHPPGHPRSVQPPSPYRPPFKNPDAQMIS